VRTPDEWYQIEQTLRERLPELSVGQRAGLSWWVYGTVQAGSGCLNAVIAALAWLGTTDTVRTRLKAWFGQMGRTEPGGIPAEGAMVRACFPWLLRWVLSWWRDAELPLALDTTVLGDRLAAVVLSVLYRGTALPIAWVLLPANTKGAWLPPLQALLPDLAGVVPRSIRVVVMTDRGWWSPRLWDACQACHWHLLARVQQTITFRPHGGERLPATTFVPRPGSAWVGAGVAFRTPSEQRAATLLVLWQSGAAAPWVLLSDLPPEWIDLSAYGLRFWIEAGFRVLKSAGWRWDATRRTDPDRVAAHWLVLSITTLLVLAAGTRAEEAAWLGSDPATWTTPLPAEHPALQIDRMLSLFTRGLAWLRAQGAPLRLWVAPLWFGHNPRPCWHAGLLITHHPHQPTAHPLAPLPL
jgi:hypothetical protein